MLFFVFLVCFRFTPHMHLASNKVTPDGGGSPATPLSPPPPFLRECVLRKHKQTIPIAQKIPLPTGVHRLRVIFLLFCKGIPKGNWQHGYSQTSPPADGRIMHSEREREREGRLLADEKKSGQANHGAHKELADGKEHRADDGRSTPNNHRGDGRSVFFAGTLRR